MSTPTSDETIAPARSLFAGFLMGCANLVPGISGGTMILAVGLYDRFIGAVADVTRLRFKRSSILFLGVLAAGVLAALLGLSGVAVDLVSRFRWVMYSLFIGLTLGGVPQLLGLCRPFRASASLWATVGFLAMLFLAWGLSDVQLPQTSLVLVGVGALAASSMILPGVSGSYVLLILGMYDLVIGSLSISDMREDVAGALRVIVPVGIGSVLGIALLSNVLKSLLQRCPVASHAALLGILVGSIAGLWPFQEPVHPDLARKDLRKATVMMLAGSPPDAVREKYGDDLDDARLAELRVRWDGHTPAELKSLGEELERFRPGGGQIALVLTCVGLGFLLTRLIGSGESARAE